jgi:hypothetical protein
MIPPGNIEAVVKITRKSKGNTAIMATAASANILILLIDVLTKST